MYYRYSYFSLVEIQNAGGLEEAHLPSFPSPSPSWNHYWMIKLFWCFKDWQLTVAQAAVSCLGWVKRTHKDRPTLLIILEWFPGSKFREFFRVPKKVSHLFFHKKGIVRIRTELGKKFFCVCVVCLFEFEEWRKIARTSAWSKREINTGVNLSSGLLLQGLQKYAWVLGKCL